MQASLTRKSRNAKTGDMPVSTTSAASCPNACPLKAAGCYAKGGPLAIHWRGVTEGTRGTSWQEFTRQVAALPEGTLWRHNQAGDLPGTNNRIDIVALTDLVEANRGRRGFTYTHKPTASVVNRAAVRDANANGFTVNLSADNLAEADQLADLSIAPVVVVLDAPEGIRHDVTTPAGRKVIIGFPAHGKAKRAAAAVARGGI